MGCLTTTQVNVIKAKIAVIDTQIAAFESSYLDSAGNSEIEEYRFNSGEGNQTAIRRSPSELRKEIEALETRRGRLQRLLDGTSNVNLNLRRRRGGHGYARYG